MSVAKDDNISFLCPNGHKLNGPAKLQGKAGKCPHCGARFEIPMLNADSGISDSGVLNETDELPIIQTVESTSDSQIPAQNPALMTTTSESFVPLDEPASEKSVAALFARLWQQKKNGAIIQLYLKDDESYVPEFFAESLSQGTHGTFAAQGSDGYLAITAIAWDSIIQIVVEKIELLPEGFE